MTEATYDKVLELNGINYVKNRYLIELAYNYVQRQALVLRV